MYVRGSTFDIGTYTCRSKRKHTAKPMMETLTCHSQQKNAIFSPDKDASRQIFLS